MTKSAKLNSEVSDTLRYQYAELAFRGTISVGVDLGDNQLNVYRQDLGHSVVVNEAPISPKKLRKFARALLALADQVDPPALAPWCEYYRAEKEAGVFYRATTGKLEVFEKRNGWVKSGAGTTVNDIKSFWSGIVVRKITESDLPQAARLA